MQLEKGVSVYFEREINNLFGHWLRITSIDKNIIRENAVLPQTHDNLFHTLLGLMDIETDLYQKNLDLTTE